MRWSWKIGEVAGIGVYVHATFLLLILFILIVDWTQAGNLKIALAGVGFVLAVFLCVVLHEFGHALAARRYGIRTRDITLLPIGGLARLERMPDEPREELAVALAGPAVNVLIAAVLYLVLGLRGVEPRIDAFRLVGGDFLNNLLSVNVVLAVFNLIPAFPMDGGRVLRALLATRLEYTRATQIAARTGQAIAFVFGLVGLFSNPFLLFIALFVWMGAEQEASMVQMRTSLGGIPVQRVMQTEFRALSAEDTLASAIEHILAGAQQDFPVLEGNRILGILTRDSLLRVLAERGSVGYVRDAMQTEFMTADSHDMLEQVLARLQDCKCRSLPVLHGGKLVGLFTMDNVGEFLMIQAALRRAASARAA
jgi:Zn-dependent protease